MECMVCDKHGEGFEALTALPLLERGGLVLTHFPVLDGTPATRGHLLIETRRHITDLAEMNDDEAGALGWIAREGTKMIRRSYGAEHVYLYRINDKVPHLHWHLIPRYPTTPREFWGMKIMEWTGSEKIDLAAIKKLVSTMKD